MKVWSKGLGKLELFADFKNYYTEAENDEVYIKGTITDPVVWDFKITVTREDIPGLTHLILNKNMLKLLLKNLPLAFSSISKEFFNFISKKNNKKLEDRRLED